MYNDYYFVLLITFCVIIFLLLYQPLEQCAYRFTRHILYPDVFHDCKTHTYYMCPFDCEQFDPYKNECVRRSSTAVVSLLCPNGFYGTFKHPYHNQKFILCTNTVAQFLTCLENFCFTSSALCVNIWQDNDCIVNRAIVLPNEACNLPLHTVIP